MVNEIKDFNIVFKRLETLGCTTQKELGRSLNISQSAVSDAKKRGKFPRGWAEKLSKKFNISLDFLLAGEYKQKPKIPEPSSVTELYERLLISEKKNAQLEERLKKYETSEVMTY